MRCSSHYLAKLVLWADMDWHLAVAGIETICRVFKHALKWQKTTRVMMLYFKIGRSIGDNDDDDDSLISLRIIKK